MASPMDAKLRKAIEHYIEKFTPADVLRNLTIIEDEPITNEPEQTPEIMLIDSISTANEPEMFANDVPDPDFSDSSAISRLARKVEYILNQQANSFV